MRGTVGGKNRHTNGGDATGRRKHGRRPAGRVKSLEDRIVFRVYVCMCLHAVSVALLPVGRGRLFAQKLCAQSGIPLKGISLCSAVFFSDR